MPKPYTPLSHRYITGFHKNGFARHQSVAQDQQHGLDHDIYTTTTRKWDGLSLVPYARAFVVDRQTGKPVFRTQLNHWFIPVEQLGSVLSSAPTLGDIILTRTKLHGRSGASVTTGWDVLDFPSSTDSQRPKPYPNALPESLVNAFKARIIQQLTKWHF
jgi:hypothetical protein